MSRADHRPHFAAEGSGLNRKMAVILCISALLCFAYGVVVFMAGSGSRFYLIWWLGGIFLAVLAGLVYTAVWRRIPAAARRVFLAAVLLSAAAFIVLEGLVLSGFGRKGRDGLDYIIVLGAQMRESGPSVVLRYRLDTAYDYLRENPGTVCILSGGQGGNEPCSEAEGMYRYLTERGIAPERLVTEDKSADTSENIAYSMPLIGSADADVGIVTNNFHIFRGVRLAKAAGMKNVCGIAAPSSPLYLPNNMTREAFGIVKDLACGNLF